MKKVCLLLIALTLSYVGFSQNVRKTYEAAEKPYREKNYNAALESLNNNGNAYVNSSDSLLYLKIKILDNVYMNSMSFTNQLDSSLRLFNNRVNRYSFSEAKYSEVVKINTNFEYFKERDKTFYDSISAVTKTKKINDNDFKEDELIKLNNRINEYLKLTPNTYYRKELTAYAKKVSIEVTSRKNKEILKTVGKKSFITIGYSLPNGDGKTVFKGFNNYSDITSYFNGTYTGGLGIKYSLNASFADAQINLYTQPRYKISIDWNIFDAEYTVFDFSTDTTIYFENTGAKSNSKEFKSVKGGTRIGPAVTVLLMKNLAVSAYYNARPGVQFILGNHYFKNVKSSPSTYEYEIKPEMVNFNLAHEIGLKFHFFRSIQINPFYHFGEYNWQNTITQMGGNSPKQKVTAKLPYQFVGIRLGAL